MNLSKFLKTLFLIFCLIFYSLASVTSPAFAATVSWTAASAGSWSVTGNWSAGALPGATDTAAFSSSSVVDCTMDITPNVSGISIQPTYTGTITATAGTGARIGASGFSIAGGSFISSSGSITVTTGSFDLSGGAFIAPSSTMTMSGAGSFSITGGTFDANNGTIQFSGAATNCWVPGNATYNNITMYKTTNGFRTVLAQSAVIAGDLNLINGFLGFGPNIGTAFVGGNLTLSPSISTYGLSVISLNGAGAQNITVLSGSAYCNELRIEKTGGSTATLSGTLAFSARHFTVASGTFATTGGASPGSIWFVATSSTWNPLSETYQDVVINKGNGHGLTLSGSANIGNLTLTGSGYLLSGTAFVSGDITVDPAYASDVSSATTVIYLNGAGAQNIIATSGNCNMNQLIIAKSGGSTVTLSGSIELSARNLIVSSGTFATTGGANTGVISFHTAAATWTPLSETYQEIIIKKNNAVAQTLTGSANIVNLTLNDGQLSTGTAFVSGNLAIGTSFDAGTAALVLSGTGAQTITHNPPGRLPSGQFTINKSGGIASLASAMSFSTASQALTLTSGTFNLAGYSLTVTGALTVGSFGVLELQGNEGITKGSLVIQPTSTVQYDGLVTSSGTVTVTTLSGTYSNLTLSSSYNGDTFLLGGAVTLNNSLNIKQGNFNTSASNYGIALAGSWINTGSFGANSSIVTLNGSNQVISGNTNFYSLSKSVTVADTLTFAAGSSQVISGTMSLYGALGQKLSLRSSVSGAYWFINPTGTRSIAYLDVKDSYNYGTTIDARNTNSTNSGHNVGWLFVDLLEALFFGTHF